MAVMAQRMKYKGIILPSSNAREAAIIHSLPVYGIANLQDAIDILEGKSELQPVKN